MTERPNTQEIITDPAAYFDTPLAVIADPSLDHDSKLKILESWRLDAMRLLSSEGENMGGGEPNRLAEIDRALRDLKQGET